MLKAGSAARRLTLNFEPSRSGDMVATMVSRFMRSVDGELQRRAPGWVGHCKVLLTEEDRSAYCSMTISGDELRWSGPFTPHLGHVEITVYAAIYGVSDQDVAAAIDTHLPDLQSVP